VVDPSQPRRSRGQTALGARPAKTGSWAEGKDVWRAGGETAPAAPGAGRRQV